MIYQLEMISYKPSEDGRKLWRRHLLETNHEPFASGDMFKEFLKLKPSHVQATGAAQPQPNGQDVLRVGPDGRSVNLRGEEFTLTPTQAQVFDILHQAWRNKTPNISKTHIMESLGLDPEKTQLGQIFKRLPNWKNLIRKGKGKDTFRLNLDL